jgi:dienelactone hydrolase
VPANTDDPRSFNHKFVDVDGIRLHYVEEGRGPLAILVHGFPYLWYAWRSQIRALAAAGYRAVAPDLSVVTARPSGQIRSTPMTTLISSAIWSA